MTTNSNSVPRLSYTVLDWIVNYSPSHAYWNHPALNPDYKETPPTKELDFAKALHLRILEDRDDRIAVLDYADYRTNASQTARDQARAEGKYPILGKDKGRLDEVVDAAKLQLSHHRDVHALLGGEAELKLRWTDIGGIDCVARLDYLSQDQRKIFDLKCTSGSAHPEAVTKRVFQMSYDIQGCFYLEAVNAIYGIDAEFYLITIETDPPYGLSVVGLDPGAKWLGQKKVEEGKRLWKEALGSGVWTGYPSQTCWATLPKWAEAAWLERETRDAAV